MFKRYIIKTPIIQDMKKYYKDSSIPPTRAAPEVRLIDFMSDLLDSRFKLPGTNLRFGLDPLIGLIPGVGDIVSYGMSSALIIGMVRQGAPFKIVMRMLWNLLLDTTLGSIPIAGDVFDVWFKSNRRNYRMFKDFVNRGEEPKPVLPIIILILVVLLGCLLLMLYMLFVWLPGRFY